MYVNSLIIFCLDLVKENLGTRENFKQISTPGGEQLGEQDLPLTTFIDSGRRIFGETWAYLGYDLLLQVEHLVNNL